MQNTLQSFENPEDGKKFYLAIDEKNIPKSIRLMEFLEEKYDEIYQSMKENDKLPSPDDSFFLFKEIIFEGKIIGYISYSILDEFEDNTIIILDSYYLFDMDNYFSLIIDDIIETGFSLGFGIVIKYPTRRFVEALIETEFAYRIDNKIIFSEIPFMTDTIALDTCINKVIDEIDLSAHARSYTISSLYDLDLCAVITLTQKPDMIYDNQRLTDDNMDDYCSISIALREDQQQYSCINKRRKNKLLKNKKYFIHVNDILTDYEQRHK